MMSYQNLLLSIIFIFFLQTTSILAYGEDLKNIDSEGIRFLQSGQDYEKMNLFTNDLEQLFLLDGKELQNSLSELEYDFNYKGSVRSGTLLSFYYLFGNYENPNETKNWKKSQQILKKLFYSTDDKNIRGSNHYSLVLFLLLQNQLIDNFNYFDREMLDYFKNPIEIDNLLHQILTDFTSGTNQAIMINSFQLCQKVKKLLIDDKIDINKIWKRIIDNSLNDSYLTKVLLNSIPIIDQCNLNGCTDELLQIAHKKSYETVQQVYDDYQIDLYQDPDKMNEEELLSVKQNKQDEIIGQEELQMLNDLANHGAIEASLTLFNLYYQGAHEVGIQRDLNLANNYLDHINFHINQNGLEGLDSNNIYNLGYAELNNETNPNYTKAIEYFQYAANEGNTEAYNALAYIYMNGFYDYQSQDWYVKQNVSYAIKLLSEGSKEGNLKSITFLAQMYINGINDTETGLVIIYPNISQAIESFLVAIEDDQPQALHMMGELIQYEYKQIPQFYIELYNLTTKQRACEMSVDFYARSILQGYLKQWLTLAHKRYELQDYEGALILYSYASMLGVSRGSYGAAYLWETQKVGRFKCGLQTNEQCALYYYINGIDYYKSQRKIADLFSWKIAKTQNIQEEDKTLIDHAAFIFYQKASSHDAYSLFYMAQYIQEGKGLQQQNATRAIELYDLLIERANIGWYVFEEMYPAYLAKWYLQFQLLLKNVINKVI